MRPLNIEEFYEYASIVAERLRCDQHTVEVGRNAGETPFRQADDIETWLKYLDEHLLDVLMRHENTADLESIRPFVSVLRPVDSIVSFNYDRLVERCLGDEQQWSFGIDPDLIGLPVLKLHGSFDWVCFARDQPPRTSHFRRLFSKRDVNGEQNGNAQARSGEREYDFELWQVSDPQTLRGLIENRATIQLDHYWGLAGLGPKKRVSNVPGLGFVWKRARHELFQADHIVIVGFSFSGHDRFVQIEFARVMAGRHAARRPNPRITVIDPSLARRRCRLTREGRELVKRIESVFRPIEPVGVPHQAFNWVGLG